MCEATGGGHSANGHERVQGHRDVRLRPGAIRYFQRTDGGSQLRRRARLSYEVQRTTNLLSPNWTVLLITNAPPKGVWQFIETNPPPGGAYYRTRQH